VAAPKRNSLLAPPPVANVAVIVADGAEMLLTPKPLASPV
jgi:hypothetical protein